MQERMAKQNLGERNIRSKTTRSLTIILVSSMNSLVEGRANAIYSTSVPLVHT